MEGFRRRDWPNPFGGAFVGCAPLKVASLSPLLHGLPAGHLLGLGCWQSLPGFSCRYPSAQMLFWWMCWTASGGNRAWPAPAGGVGQLLAQYTTGCYFLVRSFDVPEQYKQGARRRWSARSVRIQLTGSRGEFLHPVEHRMSQSVVPEIALQCKFVA